MRASHSIYWRALLALVAFALAREARPAPVDFDRDIRPIFQASCLRCHGGEKPRSHFRLDDPNAALKGGKDGVDILPGRSADSPLIKRVSSTDEDEVMPPPGKGEHLTDAQIQKLRDWIDQGAAFGATNYQAAVSGALEVGFGGVFVKGDKDKFRQVEDVNDGLFGAVRQFTFEDQINPGEKLSLDGHYLTAGQDYTLHLSWAKNDLGFIHAGFERWREYDDNIGGFDAAVSPSGLGSQSSLYLDEGRAWIDLGLTLPRGPQITLGYEQQFRVGDESTLDWGTLGGRNLAPSTTGLDERAHIFKLDIDGEIGGWQMDDSARVEIHRQNSQDNEISGQKTMFQSSDYYRSVDGSDTLHIEKSVRDWWLVSAGYCYARLEGSDTLTQTGTPPTFQYWEGPQLTLSSESHIFSLSSLFGGGSCLTLGLDLQNEWTRQEGFGNVENTFGVLAIPVVSAPIVQNANYDEFRSMQNAALRYTQIPWTIVFAEARFEQDADHQSQDGSIDGPSDAFSDRIDADNTAYDARAGFTVSPLTWISLTAQYRYNASVTAYNDLLDSTPLTGYPAFITGRAIETHEADAKLTLHPVHWLRTTLSYEVERTDFASSTDRVSPGISPGRPLLDGRYQGHIYGLSAAITPLSRLSFTGSFSYSDSRTHTFANGNPSIAPYRGGVYMTSANVSYQIDAATELNASYSFAQSSYGENNGADGIPLGLDYTLHTVAAGVVRHLNKNLSAAARYMFYRYNEPTAGGLTDFTAQGFLVSMTWHGP